MAVTAISIAGADSSQFSVTPGGSYPCPSLSPTLPAGASCTVDVAFKPTSVGAKSASLHVTSDSSINPTLDATLTGTAVIYTISGNAGVAGATLSYTDGTAKLATSDVDGNYSFTVSYNWSGDVTVSKIGYTFSPPSRTYTNVVADQPAQNYNAAAIMYTISGNVGVAGVTISYIDGTAKTAISDVDGNYSLTVSYNWSGAVTVSKVGYNFTPSSRTYTSVIADQSAQGNTATPITPTISGNVGVSGATISYSDGTSKTATSDTSGNYSFSVSYNWSGTVTVSKIGYTFTPLSRAYTNVIADQPVQNYTAAAITYSISGNVGVAGATLSYTDSTAKTATSDVDGNYSLTVSYNWSGTVTLSKVGYIFSPLNRTYTDVLLDQSTQNYTAAAIMTVGLTGTGTGTVTSDPQGTNPSGISCSSGTCTTAFPISTPVALIPLANGDSVFGGWTGDCTGSGACNVTMVSPKSVSATFVLVPFAMNASTGMPYTSLANALSVALSGAEIRTLDTQHDGSVTLNKAIFLNGGWNTTYLGKSGMSSTLNGSLTILNGASIAETIVVKGKLAVQGGSLRVNDVKVLQ